jgi:hypothetical protein
MSIPLIARTPQIERNRFGQVSTHRWPLPTDADALRAFLEDVFTHYWDQISFGPIIPGIAYEWGCSSAPDRVEYEQGYLTIGFGGPHFHLCLAPHPMTPDTPEAKAAERDRMPGQASLFRSIDPKGAPNSWGFELCNGAGDPMMSIYFANPFVLGGDMLADEPDWSRLAMWRDISARYLGLAPDPYDETSCGFRWADAA